MADRLISADALYKRYQDICMGVACNACPFLDLQNGCKVENLIDSAPTIEAEPIKHGRWIDAGDSKLHCTNCHRYIRRTVPIGYDYCPYCGAKMDEVQNAEVLEAWNLDGSPTRYIKAQKDESTMGQLNPDEPINYHIENDGTYEVGNEL